jgi:hypothetical protein
MHPSKTLNKNLTLSSAAFVVLAVLALTAACSSADETKCVDGASECGNGKIQSCAVGSSDKCKSGYYKAPDGKTFAWASCDSTTQAATDSAAYCLGLSSGAPDASTD